MGEQIKDVPSYIREMYNHDFFMNGFGINIDDIKCGSVVVSINIDPAKHFNHRGICHGGVLTALADAVTCVTGASVGAAVSTLNFNMNFIKSVRNAGILYVKSKIRHHGHLTITIEAEMYDDKHTLIATILATMFIADRFAEIPEKW